MRKYLLSTSALAGAALMSSVAVADVSITGSVEWEMISGDTDFTTTDGTSMTTNNEINIDFTNTIIFLTNPLIVWKNVIAPWGFLFVKYFK